MAMKKCGLLAMLPLVAAVPKAAPPSCRWAEKQGYLLVDLSSEGSADYFEVQVATKPNSNATAAFSTSKSTAELDFLSEDTTYYLRSRAHAVGMPSLGPGTWGAVSAEVECKTGRKAPRFEFKYPRADTFMLEVMRESEFTDDLDYLMNHNSGDIVADTAFIQFSSNDPSQPSFLNVTFRTATMTLYCLEVLKVQFNNTFSTGGDSRFADYASCNDNGNATDPQCECDNWIDRVLSDTPKLADLCHDAKGEKCSREQFAKGVDCKCPCSDASLAQTARHVGMMPVNFSTPQRFGSWFSTPKDTECSEDEHVGALRTDGSICTWKRRQEVRIVKGGDLLDLGWNTTSTGHQVDIEQIRQNAALVRRNFDAQPYKTWSCETATPSVSSIFV
eukprot:TRINITY_DN18222_c1_g1_i1.p1 TRINITY_DN18222_c1_g1~~TRINITY_DN18222_c1_g1_i1.p1  ORF type:complete len:412 (+),score=73.48 TRINITY_DN18222_c1_g1_i1:72-1238(+)